MAMPAPSTWIQTLLAKSLSPMAILSHPFSGRISGQIMSSIVALPSELTDLIIDQLWTDGASLSACALVSPSFLARTRALRFRNLFFDPPRPHIPVSPLTIEHGDSDVPPLANTVGSKGLWPTAWELCFAFFGFWLILARLFILALPPFLHASGLFTPPIAEDTAPAHFERILAGALSTSTLMWLSSSHVHPSPASAEPTYRHILSNPSLSPIAFHVRSLCIRDSAASPLSALRRGYVYRGWVARSHVLPRVLLHLPGLTELDVRGSLYDPLQWDAFPPALVNALKHVFSRTDMDETRLSPAVNSFPSRESLPFIFHAPLVSTSALTRLTLHDVLKVPVRALATARGLRHLCLHLVTFDLRGYAPEPRVSHEEGTGIGIPLESLVYDTRPAQRLLWARVPFPRASVRSSLAFLTTGSIPAPGVMAPSLISSSASTLASTSPPLVPFSPFVLTSLKRLTLTFILPAEQRYAAAALTACARTAEVVVLGATCPPTLPTLPPLPPPLDLSAHMHLTDLRLYHHWLDDNPGLIGPLIQGNPGNAAGTGVITTPAWWLPVLSLIPSRLERLELHWIFRTPPRAEGGGDADGGVGNLGLTRLVVGDLTSLDDLLADRSHLRRVVIGGFAPEGERVSSSVHDTQDFMRHPVPELLPRMRWDALPRLRASGRLWAGAPPALVL
ncbi:hypothetical protein FISHEDRAFT_70081 [Fistulina hepatica ATCC 64428]|uniref:Uncharacterized protein n=1 Tax=Fistulina hepatica ATCC 64428 TaxID=1128425 RepID=A0A0D7AMV7_9AGAR|nr:hypothetical protein FISHEDRAFT_70081 [Fistulina hepatica ATCC 64428]